MIAKEIIQGFRVEPGKRIRLTDYATSSVDAKELKVLGKDAVKQSAKVVLEKNLKALSDAQELLYADNRYSILMILQGIDAAGKDGTIKHVMSGVNPQGCQVFSFKRPSAEELDHNFLWRYLRRLPERGRIGIFNRSYFEDVLVVKVHPELLNAQSLPPGPRGDSFWQQRYEDINALERHLTRNGTVILKFFLHLSKEEQKRRFLDRLDRPEKNWKFSAADVAERAFWPQYEQAFEDALNATSTDCAPWYIVPADQKWVTRAVVADILTRTIRSLDLKFPEPSQEERKALEVARKTLANE